MSNICRRCGHLIEYSLVPLKSIHTNHCHFCVSEFNALVEKLNIQREKALADFEVGLKKKLMNRN